MKAATQERIPNVIYWGELPVPYVAAWSSESGIRITRDPVIGNRPALFRTGERGEGKPIFGKMDEARVRYCVSRRWCQVCARPFGAECFVADVVKGTYGRRSPIINEPACCERCFYLAIAECPGLQRQRARLRFLAAKVRRYEVIASQLGVVEGGDEDLNEALRNWPGDAPVGYLRLALIDYDILDLGEVRS